jgi:hypothetical protein
MYTYQPLEYPRSIRLVKLYPARCRTDTVVCDLIHVSLENCLPFEALSYTWGDPSVKHTISCSKEQLETATNLLSALQHLRQLDSTRLIWIDAICINQHDLDERTQQVQLMREIYHKAEEVLVWLGPEIPDSPRCFQLVPKLASAWEERDEVRQEGQQSQGVLTVHEAKQLGLPELDDPIWQTLKRILHPPWFDRVWIIQEVAVAKRVTVICGDETVIWEDLVESSLLISEGGIHGDIEGSGTGNIATIDGFRIQVRDGEEFDLLVLMRLSRPSLATNPQDKVYALLGTTEEHDRDVIRPDYKIPVRDLYCRIARYFIERDQKLDVLCQAGYGRSIPDLPSWAPDWSVPVSADDQDLVDVSHPGYWLDTEKYPALIRLSDNPDHLIARGKIVDIISGMGTVFEAQSLTEDTQTAQQRITSVIREWERLILGMQTYPTGEAVIEAYWRTLIAGADKENEEAPVEFGNSFARWYNQFHSTAFDLSELHHRTSSTSEEAAKIYGSCVQETCRGRRLFTTTMGYMGVGVKGGLQGDHIAILSGSIFPCLVRSKGDCFTFVGECYIHGLDLNKIMADGDLEFQDLILQ